MNQKPNNDAPCDSSQRFLFEEADIRGEHITLSTALNAVYGEHAYSVSVRELLGQFAAAAVLISNNLKYHGKIVLQARSQSALSLIMIECTSDSQIRGIARGDIETIVEDPIALIAEGQLAITIERDGGQRYQGIVDLQAATLAAALDNYFLQSEQLNTHFWLAADGDAAAGLMLQQLPAQQQQSAEDREAQWQDALILANTVTPEELLMLPATVLLHRLYHEHPLRLFETAAVVFHCSCSRERSLNALTCLPPSELNELFAEQGDVELGCEMCGKSYRFTAKDLTGLAEPPVLH